MFLRLHHRAQSTPQKAKSIHESLRISLFKLKLYFIIGWASRVACTQNFSFTFSTCVRSTCVHFAFFFYYIKNKFVIDHYALEEKGKVSRTSRRAQCSCNTVGLWYHWHTCVSRCARIRPPKIFWFCNCRRKSKCTSISSGFSANLNEYCWNGKERNNIK